MDIISPAEQVSTELREQGQLEKALQKQIEFDRLIARISSRFIQLPWENLDQEINQSLQQMGKFLKVDTSYIFHYSEDGQTASMTHEWMSEGLSPQLNNQQNLPCAAFPWASATMGAGKTVVFSQLDELPPEATLDARNWRNLGVKSVLAFPLHSRQKVTGFVGFVSFKQEQIWTENMIQILQIFSEILSFMIQRQEAEKKLQLTEARYASLAESVPVGIFRTDAQGNCLYVNQRWCQMAGFGEELALGHGWLKALHPEDGDRIMSKWLSSIEEKKPFQEEYRFQRPDGKVIWVVGQALPEYDATGEIDGYIGTITDISDRQQMAMSLQLSEEKLKEARQIAHLGSWELDLTTNNLIWSDECYHIFELDPQQFKPSYQTFLDIIHPEDRELVDRVYTESLKNRHPYSIIHRLQMKDGRLKYIQEQCHHYYDQAGNPLRSMGIVQDISQQKITEEILKDNEERLHLALKATNQGLYDLNVQTGKALVNDEYALMLGYNPSEFEETNAKWVERLHPDDQEVVANNYRAYVNNEIPEYKVEFRQRTKSGEWKWILSLGKIIAWDAQGQPLRMLGTHTDISKQKAVEEALQENKRQLSNLIDNLPGYVYRVKNDPNYTPLFISEGVYHITEYRQEEYLIEHTADSGKEIYPEDIDFLWQQIQQAVKNKQPFEFEYRIITKSGKIKWVWERGRGCWDDKGNLLYLEGFVTDVTARKEAQLALQKSYQEYNDLVNRIPVGVYKFHRSASGQLKFDYVSPQWCELNQISEEEIAQDINLFYQQVHPDDFGHLMELNQVAYETLEQFIWEGRLIINGEVRWMHIESSPIMLDNGDLIWDGIQYDITDRIRAEQEREKLLAEAIAARTEASTARDMLASVFERMNDGIVALDNQLHYTYLNKNGAALLGRTPEQLIRKYIWAEFPEGIGQPFYHAYYQALKEQKPIYIEDYYAPWDRWFENRIYPSADGLTIYFTDISDRKKAELQRLESEKLKLELNLLEKILNIVLAGYWDWDMVNHTSYMSPRLKRMFGYNDDELPNVPETWQNLIFPEDLPPTLQCFEQHVKSHGEIPYYNEVRYRHKNGSTVWVICSGQVIEWDEMGNPLRIIGCHVDITTRKNAEAALQESEARFRYLADNAPVLIWMSGLDKLYFHFNKGWLEFTGRTLAQEMGNGWTQGLHPDDFQFCLDTYSQAFERREKFAMEYRLKRHDGEYRWLLDTGVPRFDANGEFVGYIGSCVDIGDRKQVEEEIQQKTRQLEATNKELESFSYSVSHDLRAPLRHINGFVNALRQQLEQNSALKDEKVARYLEVIESSSQKMAQLIDGLLTLSRIGRRDMEFQALNLREIVEDVLSLTQITDNYATSVEFIIGDLPNITGDATLLKQVFTNLISNAVKFSRNHPTPLVEIGSLSDQTIFVKDNGAGFSMDYADKLFGAFQRLHSQKEFEGTGIGLAIAQRIIARHGGLIWAESKVNHGATFYFKIN